MATPVQNIEFFQNFIEQTISEEVFVEKLQKLTTEVQKKHYMTNDQIEQVAQCTSKIENDIYNKNVKYFIKKKKKIELFLKFALYLANRGIYTVLENYGNDFDLINLAGEKITQNILALYIIKRVYHSENHKVLLIFLNGVLRGQKQIEKKLVILEIYTKIIPLLEKKHLHLREILPLILMVIKEALDKYLKYKQKRNDNTLNESNEFVQKFMQKFQQWTVSFFKRIFSQLRNTSEIKQCQQQQVIKTLLTISDLYDYDPENDQILQKAENPALALKHLVLLFLFDLYDGILEVKQTLSASQLEPQVIDELYQLVQKMIHEIHSDQLDLITNYLEFVNYSIQRGSPILRHTPYYELNIPYNPVALGSILYSLLFENVKEDRNIKQLLSPQYKLRLLCGFFYEMKLMKDAKCDVFQKLVQGVVQILAGSKAGTLPKQIQNSNYFIVPFHEILLQILERAGQGVSKEEEQKCLEAWKQVSEMFSIDCYSHIIVHCIKQSQNADMLGHLTNSFRSQIIGKIKDKSLNIEQAIKIVDPILDAIAKKSEQGTIDQRLQIVDSFILILSQMSMINQKQQQSLIKWKPTLLKFQKSIQQQFDYLANKEKENQEKDASSELVYKQIASQRQIIQITYYNLEECLNKFKQQ